MAFGTDESVLFREVSLIQGVLIERFHCICIPWLVLDVNRVVDVLSSLDKSIRLSQYIE